MDETDGARLARLLGDRNRTAFAKEHGIRGGVSMISQHVSGNRPIGLEAAIAYARALQCRLPEVSPSAAALATEAASFVAPGSAPAPSSPLNPADAIAVVLDALLSLPAARWDSVRAQIDAVVANPELRDERLEELQVLFVAPSGKQQTRRA